VKAPAPPDAATRRREASASDNFIVMFVLRGRWKRKPSVHRKYIRMVLLGSGRKDVFYRIFRTSGKIISLINQPCCDREW